jgi:hypothetical protein
MKTLVDSSTLDVRNACITADTMKHLSGNGTTDIGYWEHFCVNSTCWASWKLSGTSSGVSLPRLVNGFCEAASGAVRDDYSLPRGVAPSSSQLLLHRPLKARLLMTLCFRTSTDSPTVGLWFEPQYERIPLHVFSRGFGLEFWVSRHLKPASFTVLHTCWAVVMSISHPFCEGGQRRKAGLSTEEPLLF